MLALSWHNSQAPLTSRWTARGWSLLSACQKGTVASWWRCGAVVVPSWWVPISMPHDMTTVVATRIGLRSIEEGPDPHLTLMLKQNVRGRGQNAVVSSQCIGLFRLVVLVFHWLHVRRSVLPRAACALGECFRSQHLLRIHGPGLAWKVCCLEAV